MAVRSISMLGPTFTKMGTAAAKANVAGIEAATKHLGAVVETSGSRFHVKGRNGSPVRLGASTDVRGFASQRNGLVVAGAVRGVPQGFWEIIEHGSGPHLITRRNAKGRTTRARTLVSRLENDRTINAGKPIRTPYGPRQFVHHPGHRPIGSPWALAMRLGAPRVANTVAAHETRALVRAFT